MNTLGLGWYGHGKTTAHRTFNLLLYRSGSCEKDNVAHILSHSVKDGLAELVQPSISTTMPRVQDVGAGSVVARTSMARHIVL